jgi:hypothetical protein
MYDAPGHPQSISIENEYIPVLFLSSYTTSLLQPLYRDIIRCVKASYTRQFLEMFRKSCYIYVSELSAVSRNGGRCWNILLMDMENKCVSFCIWRVE